MNPLIAAAGIGAATSLAGGLLGQGTAKDADQTQKDNAYLNIKMQQEFAQNGIRWKVEDAKAAGVHPLYALGANTASYSPVSVGSTADNSMGNAVANMGQNISRAISATATQQEREMNNLRIASAQEDIKGKQLQNQILASQVSTINQPRNPPMPSGGTAFEGLSGQQPGVKVKASQTTSTMPGQPAQEAGIIPDVAWARTSNGGLTPVPSSDIKERIEDNLIQETMHAIRNNLMPNIGKGPTPPDRLLPKGYDRWGWSPTGQEYVPVKSKKYNTQDFIYGRP